jgi:hypothetical protein
MKKMRKLVFAAVLLMVCSPVFSGQLLWHLPFDNDLGEALSGELAYEVESHSLADSPFDKQAPGLAPGMGVNGTGGALDMSVSMKYSGDHSPTNYGGWVEYGDTSSGGNVDDALNGLVSFTLMGWLNTGDPSISPNNSRVFLRDDNANGLTFLVASGGRPKVAINGNWYNGQYIEPYPFAAQDEWKFFAIVYDSTAGSNNLKIYEGSANTDDVVLWEEVDFAHGALANNDRPFVIGNNGGSEAKADKGYKGLIDELRLYGSYLDSTGALSAAEITSYKNQDIVPGTETGVVPDPVWYFPFDENMLDQISGEGPSLVFANPNANSPYDEQPPFIASGEGVNPLGGALDLRDSMEFMGAVSGENTNGGSLRYGNNNYDTGHIDDVIDNLSSFTLTFWLTSGDPLVGLSGMSSGARVMRKEDTTNSFTFLLNNDGKLNVGINGNWNNMPTSGAYTLQDEWVFVAVTYDANEPTDNLKYYSARKNDGYPVLEYTATLNAGPLDDTDRQFVFGNNGSTTATADKGFKGLIDEARLFGSYSDGSGALSMAQISSLKKMDLTAECGDFGYPSPLGDINNDCIVDLFDFSYIAEEWLTDNRPGQ